MEFFCLESQHYKKDQEGQPIVLLATFPSKYKREILSIFISLLEVSSNLSNASTLPIFG